MTKKIFGMIAAIWFAFCLDTGQAQVRPDILSFSQIDRDNLANAMMTYINNTIIQQHCDYTAQSGSSLLNIHSDFDFLPFHRVYIEMMEDYLWSLGPYYQQFVPLPKWDPATCIPGITPGNFQVVDPDCATTTCGNASFNCTTPTNWCPLIVTPVALQLPAVVGPNNDLCDWLMSPTTPPVVVADHNCCPNGLSRVIEGQLPNGASSTFHNTVHNNMGQIMANFRSPAAPIFFLWHAFVDDKWKEWEENCPSSTTQPVDLYMKDNHLVMQSVRDRGEQPDIDPGPMWLSQDIWVRNTNDGFTNQTHQNPIVDGVNPVYIYVRVRNRGYQQSLGSEQLEVRWAKAATALTWPNNWNGSVDLDPPNNLSAGDLILPSAVQTISVIDPGDEQVFEFPWMGPNPSDYNTVNTEPWHFCLLARILAANDPMAFVETSDLNGNVKNNNNIVWKNITIIDNNPAIAGGGTDCPGDVMQSLGTAVGVGNQGEPGVFDFTLEAPHETEECDEEGCTHEHCMIEAHVHDFTEDPGFHQHVEVVSNGLPITKEGTVMFAMDDALYLRWKEGGKVGTGFVEIKSGDPKPDLGSLVAGERHMFQITDCPATFGNIFLGTNENHTTSLMALYPLTPVSDKQRFKYDIIQRRTVDGLTIGGVQYHIKKPKCNPVTLDAGPDETINKGCITTLKATPVIACANYWWIDDKGKVVGHNTNVIVSPNATTTYTLKVISPEGCIYEDKITIKVTTVKCEKKTKIVTVSPNPANEVMVVTYKLDEVKKAELVLLKTDNSVKKTFSIDPVLEEVKLNVADLPFGTYLLLLVTDGSTVDYKVVIIE